MITEENEPKTGAHKHSKSKVRIGVNQQIIGPQKPSNYAKNDYYSN